MIAVPSANHPTAQPLDWSHDFSVNGSSVSLAFGYTYESGSYDSLIYGNDYKIKEMETYEVRSVH